MSLARLGMMILRMPTVAQAGRHRVEFCLSWSGERERLPLLQISSWSKGSRRQRRGLGKEMRQEFSPSFEALR